MNSPKFIALFVVVVTCLMGCSKREPAEQPIAQTTPKAALRVHWIGKEAVARDTNAAGLMRIWDLPESKALELQTLERLAAAPWRSKLNWTTNALQGRPAELSILARTLLQQILENEAFVEVRHPSNSSPAFALAVRLAETNAYLWETNFAAIAENLLYAKSKASESGWQLRPEGGSNVLSFQKVKGGVAIAWGAGTDSLIRDIASQLEKPAPAATNNEWLAMHMALPRLMSALGKQAAWVSRLPEVSLSTWGDGTNVFTRSEMKFAQPLPFSIEKWQVPTNLIHDPIHSFGALQGLKPLLANSELWTRFTGGAQAPNQYFWWAQAGAPFLSYGAIPVSDLHSTFSNLSVYLPEYVNPRLTNVMAGKLVLNPEEKRLAWTPFPAMEPAITAAALPEGRYLQISLAASDNTNRAAPQGTISDLVGRTNLVYYHRELTGARMEPGLYISQLSRLVFRRDQLPFDGKSIAWLKTISTLLGEAKTEIVLHAPDHLILSRKSSLGFTMAELQVFADWVESPEFPLRLHSQAVKLPPRGSSKKTIQVPSNE